MAIDYASRHDDERDKQADQAQRVERPDEAREAAADTRAARSTETREPAETRTRAEYYASERAADANHRAEQQRHPAEKTPQPATTEPGPADPASAAQAHDERPHPDEQPRGQDTHHRNDGPAAPGDRAGGETTDEDARRHPESSADDDAPPPRPGQERRSEPRYPPPSGSEDPRTTPDGGWEWKGLRLEPPASQTADKAVAARRDAEGRDAEGSYGDRGITPGMRRAESQLDHGSLAPDTEKYALKTPDRFKEKLARRLADRPDKSAEEVAAGIHDGIRYTFIFPDRCYTEDTAKLEDKLGEQGYQLIERLPKWGEEEYKGINTRWKDHESGQLFEIQYHTQGSWEAKQQTHDVYETLTQKLNDPDALPAEIKKLRTYQREVTAAVPVPEGALEIEPYKNKDR